MSEMLFVEILRRYADDLAPNQTGCSPGCATHEVPARAIPGRGSTRGKAASSGLNGRASQPRKPQMSVVSATPPPSRRAVVAPCEPTLFEKSSCGGLGANKERGSTASVRGAGALDITW
jgi:hypothetical protein